MAGLFALIASALVAWGVHALIGDHVSAATDFVVGLVVSGAVYIATFYWLKKLRAGY